MGEIIGFAWGISSLGDFMVAMSNKGLVTMEFSSNHSKERIRRKTLRRAAGRTRSSNPARHLNKQSVFDYFTAFDGRVRGAFVSRAADP
jgi:hypothetical protein